MEKIKLTKLLTLITLTFAILASPVIAQSSTSGGGYVEPYIIPPSSAGGSGGSIAAYSKTCTYTWGSTSFIGETVTITASITDSAGRAVSDSVTVNVVEQVSDSAGVAHSTNPDILNIQITEPADGSNVAGKVNIKISANRHGMNFLN